MNIETARLFAEGAADDSLVLAAADAIQRILSATDDPYLKHQAGYADAMLQELKRRSE